MNTVTALSIPRVSLLHCYALAGRLEFLRLLRSPAFAVPTLLFAPMFYLLFAVLMNRGGSGEIHANVYLLATYSVFGVMMPGLFGFGVSVALDRERGWLTLKRAQPMPAGAYLAAKLMMAMLFAAIIFAILAVVAATLGGARLPLGAWLSLFAVDVFGVLPFCAIGLAIGVYANAQGAPAIINLVYLPLSFLSGLWMPLDALPAVVRDVAPLWPPYHLSQLALAAVGQPVNGSLAAHVGVLAAYTIGFLAIARRRLARSA